MTLGHAGVLCFNALNSMFMKTIRSIGQLTLSNSKVCSLEGSLADPCQSPITNLLQLLTIFPRPHTFSNSSPSSQPSLPNPLHILIFHSSQLLNPSHIQHCAMLCKCPWTDLPPEFCLHFSSSTISPRSSSSSSHIYITPWDFHLTHTLTNPILCLPSLALNDAHLNGYSDPSGNAPEPPMHYSLDSPSDSTQHS